MGEREEREDRDDSSVSYANQPPCANFGNSNEEHLIYIQRLQIDVGAFYNKPSASPLLTAVVLQIAPFPDSLLFSSIDRRPSSCFHPFSAPPLQSEAGCRASTVDGPGEEGCRTPAIDEAEEAGRRDDMGSFKDKMAAAAGAGE
jgi:hypothetical protein